MFGDEEFKKSYPYLSQYTQPVKQAEREIVGRQDEMRSILAAFRRPELCNVMLLGEAGSGKAIANDEWLPVADDRGYIHHGDVEVGDYVFGANGEPVRVTGVYPQGMKEAYRVSFADGSSVVCNDEHLWTVTPYCDSNEYVVMTLRDIINCGDMKFYVPRMSAVQRDQRELPVHPYVMGFCIGSNTENIFENLRISADTSEMCVPFEYFLGSAEQRRLLLNGIIDGGGDIYDGVFRYLTENERLASDISTLAASIGIRSYIDYMDVGCQVIFDSRDSEGLFLRNPYGYEIPKIHTLQRNSSIEITNIECLNEEVPMTCIMVDSEDHTYQVTEKHIVTHNTMLVQGTMLRDFDRIYLEVDLAKMIADLNDPNEMAAKLKSLFDETAAYGKKEGKELVLFIDEFHQIVQLSAAAVEALKPLLADSGTRGIRVIAATTYIEFRKFIASNQPLVERLQRINLSQPDKKTTVDILKGMARRYDVIGEFYNDSLFEMIYEYTNRYIPANSQPRKSILVLDAMVGWHRAEGLPFDLALLADVIYESEGVNVAFRVDATQIKAKLDERVLSQHFATRVIEERLQICVADLNDKSKPMSSFLFTGSTGVGKGLTNDTLIPVWTSDGLVREKKNGDLQVGDYVFNRKGKPVEVLGVFPQGMQDIYKVSLSDNRVIYTDGSHLWKYASNDKGDNICINNTKELFSRGWFSMDKRSHKAKPNYWIPVGEPVAYPDCDFNIHPYVVGAFISSGRLTAKQLTLSVLDDNIVNAVVAHMGDYTVVKHGDRVCTFNAANSVRSEWSDTFFSDYPELKSKRLSERRIPREYMLSSISQRWDLVKGLFDTKGTIEVTNKGQHVLSYSTTSELLAQDLQYVLNSLGILSSIQRLTVMNSGKKYFCYKVIPNVSPSKMSEFFDVRQIEYNDVYSAPDNGQYDWVSISDIELMPDKQNTTCIYIKDDEHLYQAGQYIVTHNTEMTKQLARILFDDERRLLRFDMTEYANPDSLERFRSELTARVWERPYSIILLDEIEKACAPITRLLLQVLDDGRLMDENNREVSFTNSYIVITTNAGSEIYKNIAQYNVDDTGSGLQMKKYNKLIRESIAKTTSGNKFPPELLGRIDTIVPFQPLSEQTQKDIVSIRLRKLIDEVKMKHNVILKIATSVVDYLVMDNMDTDSDSGGARAVMSKLEAEVTTEVARYINSHPHADAIGVVVEGATAYDNKTQLESKAHIRVTRVRL